MTTYTDVVRANGALYAWSLTEPSGTTFVPAIGPVSLTGGGIATYRDTGPFGASFGLKLAAGGRLRLPFPATVQPPATTELWVKLSALPVTSYQLLLRAGTTGGSGNGFYVDPTGNHVWYTAPATGPIDLGWAWPDTNWHLFQWSSSAGNILSAYLDGALRWRSAVGTPSSASPNVMGMGCDGNTDNSQNIVTLADPAFYPTELTPSQAYATFLAASDPPGALAYVTNAAGTGLQLVNATLTDITNLLYRDFPLP